MVHNYLSDPPDIIQHILGHFYCTTMQKSCKNKNIFEYVEIVGTGPKSMILEIECHSNVDKSTISCSE